MSNLIEERKTWRSQLQKAYDHVREAYKVLSNIEDGQFPCFTSDEHADISDAAADADELKCFLASLLGEVNPDPDDEDGSDSRDEE